MRTRHTRAGILLGALLLAVTVSCTAPAPATLSAADAQAIRDTVTALDHAMNYAVDNLDCTKGLSFIANRPPVFVSFGHVVQTRSELLALCQRMVAPRSGAVFDPDSVTAYALGPNAAYVVRSGEYTVHFRNGRTGREHLAVTTIWQRSDRGWKMVHLHESGIPDTTAAGSTGH